MKPSQALLAHRDAVRAIVSAHRGANARIFGSVADGRDGEASDLDILIDPAPDATLFDIGAIRFELRQLLGIEVDVLTPGALPEEFRDAVIASAKPL
jgi:predicted nucleotidyltransferase